MIGQWFPYTRLRRDQNCTRVTAFILALLQALGWIFLRLESPNWQALQAQHKRLYPHLANKRPSIGDPLRYAIQTVWLLFVRPIDENHQRRQRARRRSERAFSTSSKSCSARGMRCPMHLRACPRPSARSWMKARANGAPCAGKRARCCTSRSGSWPRC